MKISKNCIAVVATFAFGSLLSVNGNNLRVTNEGYEDPALDVRSDGERKLSHTPMPDDLEDKVGYLEEEIKGTKQELKEVVEKQQKTGTLTTEDAHVKAFLEKELMEAKEKLSQAEEDEDAEEKLYDNEFMGDGYDNLEDHGRSLAVTGGKIYTDRCVPGHNDFPAKKNIGSQDACYEFCKNEPSCKTADYLKGKCYPSKAGIDKAKSYNNCDMWVKDPVGLSVGLCSKDKLVRVTKFIINGDDDSGPNGEHQLRLQGKKYFPNKATDCTQDPKGYCSWREGQTHHLHQKGPWVKVVSHEALQAGTEEDDDWSENDSYTASLTKEQWYNPTCNQYEIKVSKEFKVEVERKFCISGSASVTAEGEGASGTVGVGAESCSKWVAPSESYTWVLSVIPFRGQLAAPTKKSDGHYCGRRSECRSKCCSGGTCMQDRWWRNCS